MRGRAAAEERRGGEEERRRGGEEERHKGGKEEEDRNKETYDITAVRCLVPRHKVPRMLQKVAFAKTLLYTKSVQ